MTPKYRLCVIQEVPLTEICTGVWKIAHVSLVVRLRPVRLRPVRS
jgi:hypothetical protein